MEGDGWRCQLRFKSIDEGALLPYMHGPSRGRADDERVQELDLTALKGMLCPGVNRGGKGASKSK